MMLGVDDMMSSDCSTGGCQSGWTMYLDQSNNSYSYSYSNHNNHLMHDQDNEEDLSMLSDASSGPSPALFHEDYLDDFLGNNVVCSRKTNSTGAKTDKQQKQKRIIQSSSNNNNPNCNYLDDTASSTLYEHAFINGDTDPALRNYPAAVDFSSSSSTTQFKDKSVFQFENRLSYFQSPPDAKPMPQSQRPHVRKESAKKKMR